MVHPSIATAAALIVLTRGAPAITASAIVATPGGGSAADVVGELNAEGYDVRLNGQSEGSLAQCTVTGIHRTSTLDAAVHSPLVTAYVDIDCPGGD